jgi:hypothetical protein
MMKAISPLAVRFELEQIAGLAIPETMWDYLVKDGKVDIVANGQKSVSWLSDRLWDLDKVSGEKLLASVKSANPAPEMLRPEKAQEVDQRQQFLSGFFADEANKRRDVAEYRNIFLKAQLISFEAVGPWIEKQAAEEGKPTHYVDGIPLEGTRIDWEKEPGRLFLKPALNLTELPIGSRLRSDFLSYAKKGSEWAFCLPVKRGASLDKLRILSLELAKKYPWQEAQATIFVLTGIPPWVSSLEVRTGNAFAEVLGRRAISMEIDPFVSPRKVLEAYSRVRAEILPVRRARKLTDRHARLATFLVGRPENETWRERMTAWNKSNRSYQYKFEGTFRRDALAAKQRMLGTAGQPTINLLKAQNQITKPIGEKK